MPLQVRKEGHFAPLFFFAFSLIAGPAAAQQDGAATVEGAIRACAALRTDELKLACFDALAARYANSPAADPESPQAHSSADTPADRAASSQRDAPPVVVEAGTADADAAAARAAVNNPPAEAPVSAVTARPDVRAATGGSASNEPQAVVAPGTAATPVSGTAANAPSRATDTAGVLGAAASGSPREAEREEPGEGDTDVLIATVEKVERARGRNLLYFEFANGEVWRQMEPGFIHYPKDTAFDVHIRRGLMGDYQLRVGGEGRMTRIVRVK